MAKPVSIFLGVFAAGELPFDFQHTFQDANGNDIDLTGYTPTVEFEGPDEAGTYGQGSVALDMDPTTGIVSYTWHTNDFQDVGKYEFVIWVDNGTYRLASDLVKYEVYDAPGPTPS